MKRRDLLRMVGTTAALSYIPGNAGAAWARVTAGYIPPSANGLTPAQLALVAALSDQIIPRTDSPGATDVAVPAWVNLIVAEYYNDSERNPFLAGLDAIDVMSIRTEGTLFADLSPAAKDRVMAQLDQPTDRNTPEARAYSRLKGLVIHGYFTSERVQKDVLKTQIMPMKFDGAALHQIAARPS